MNIHMSMCYRHAGCYSDIGYNRTDQGVKRQAPSDKGEFSSLFIFCNTTLAARLPFLTIIQT